MGGVDVVRREGLLRFEQWLLNVVFWVLALLLVYEWLSLSLAQFPYTRPWGEQLNGFLFGMLGRFALAIVHAMPDLLAAALIFWLAWVLTHVLRGFFAKVGAGQVRLSWLDADVARSPPSCASPRSGCSRWPWPIPTCRARTPRPSRACRCWSA